MLVFLDDFFLIIVLTKCLASSLEVVTLETFVLYITLVLKKMSAT